MPLVLRERLCRRAGRLRRSPAQGRVGELGRISTFGLHQNAPGHGRRRSDGPLHGLLLLVQQPYVFPCWPCWPVWWDCWPWWWERDILYVIEALERNQSQPNRSFASLQSGNILTRPQGVDLVRGQGFASFRKQAAEYRPDPARTALIKRKLANADIRELPYWWWCCDNPNIVFDVTQAPQSSSARIPRQTPAGACPTGAR